MFKRAADIKVDEAIDLAPIIDMFKREGVADGIDKPTEWLAEAEYALVEEVKMESTELVYIGNSILDVAVPVNYMVEVANV